MVSAIFHWFSVISFSNKNHPCYKVGFPISVFEQLMVEDLISTMIN